ncbi:MAG TPA: tetratricopeptide repeat protein [Phycisphaerales bacterium]|nr:tetratricopeptide repeat protein [Phycisphaerales bacterium]
MRIRCSIVSLAILAAAVSLAGCSPSKSGVKNRQAANDRMNVVAAQINLEQAEQFFSTGQLDEALREIDRAIARYPDAGEYHLMRGRILLEQAKLEQSLDAFTTALEKNPKLADAHYYAGVIYQRWSDDEQAHTCYQAAFDLQPEKVHYLLASAEALVAMGEFDRAEELIDPKMAYFEHNASLRQLQAQIAMLKGEPKRSAEMYAEARLLNPDDSSLLEEMIWAQYAAGMYSQCYESASMMQAKSTQPRTDLTHLQARCLAMMGRGVEARELYLQLVKTRSADPSVWSELGTLCWELGDYRNLAQSSTQMIAIAPDRYEGYLFRAVNERHKGNNAEAQRLLKEACRRAGGISLPFLMLGQSLEQSGDNDGAALAYNQALQVDPDSAEAKALLSRLNGEQQISEAPEP